MKTTCAETGNAATVTYVGYHSHPNSLPLPSFARQMPLRQMPLRGIILLVGIYIFGSHAMQQHGSRWNLTFILTDIQDGYVIAVYAKGEALNSRRCRASCGLGSFLRMSGFSTPIALLYKLYTYI